jgi:hypothetical protein
MARKKKVSISKVMAAHVDEQIEAASDMFVREIGKYNTEAVVMLLLPDGSNAVFVCSRDGTAESNKKILSKCFALLNPKNDFRVDY